MCLCALGGEGGEKKIDSAVIAPCYKLRQMHWFFVLHRESITRVNNPCDVTYKIRDGKIWDMSTFTHP